MRSGDLGEFFTKPPVVADHTNEPHERFPVQRDLVLENSFEFGFNWRNVTLSDKVTEESDVGVNEFSFFFLS